MVLSFGMRGSVGLLVGSVSALGVVACGGQAYSLTPRTCGSSAWFASSTALKSGEAWTLNYVCTVETHL